MPGFLHRDVTQKTHCGPKREKMPRALPGCQRWWGRDEHRRHDGFSGDVMGHAAEQEFASQGGAMRTDDDERGPGLLSRERDFPRGEPRCDARLDLEPWSTSNSFGSASFGSMTGISRYFSSSRCRSPSACKRIRRRAPKGLSPRKPLRNGSDARDRSVATTMGFHIGGVLEGGDGGQSSRRTSPESCRMVEHASEPAAAMTVSGSTSSARATPP
jgi:hypothetical protein